LFWSEQQAPKLTEFQLRVREVFWQVAPLVGEERTGAEGEELEQVRVIETEAEAAPSMHPGSLCPP